MELKAHIQHSVSHSPQEREPLEGYERDALFLLPAFFWICLLKALPVMPFYLKMMDSQPSIIHKWIVHLGIS